MAVSQLHEFSLDESWKKAGYGMVLEGHSTVLSLEGKGTIPIESPGHAILSLKTWGRT